MVDLDNVMIMITDSGFLRLTYVKVLGNREVVGNELERDDRENALETVNALGHEDLLQVCGDVVIADVADDDGLVAARRDLGECVLALGVVFIDGHDKHHGHVLVDEGEGAVLELACHDALAVKVRHLLDFLFTKGKYNEIAKGKRINTKAPSRAVAFW